MTIEDVEALKQAIASGRTPAFLLFWGHTAKTDEIGKHVLSQWWPAAFSLDGRTYATAEHYMMAHKAELFGDQETRDAILAAPGPSQAKTLGRAVRGFDDDRWIAHRFDVAVRGNVAKFGQNPELAAWLRSTGDAVLVEASPVDRIWGIGLAADDARAREPARWRGLNLLGFALMKVRAALQ
ncbi:NADAR family protein [Bradyrhizobium ontarionense]|uniref:NADAR family protein n=1 Tax=Bradyrhizobium ontarionense TaxID=2898149 RepID=A0ABY3RDL5_9BRAD|nr:NADAR family protein [Bradyrhizobium sp. A19]UFZ05192.1 NADAR family protein [Bradyrhizobium sp. A19]